MRILQEFKYTYDKIPSMINKGNVCTNVKNKLWKKTSQDGSVEAGTEI